MAGDTSRKRSLQDLIDVTPEEVNDCIVSCRESGIEKTEDQARKEIKENKLTSIKHILSSSENNPNLYLTFFKSMGRLPEDILNTLAYERKVRFLFMKDYYGRAIYRPKESDHYEIIFGNVSELDEEEILGVIAHELAHVILEHKEEPEKITGEPEEEADNLASEWGFGNEIEELRKAEDTRR